VIQFILYIVFLPIYCYNS